MTISAGFMWNFEDVIIISPLEFIYYSKISLNDCTDFEAKNAINVGPYRLWLRYL